MPYDPKIDVWSIGAILAELSSGLVLFQNTSAPTLLARLESIFGPIPLRMLLKGKYSKTMYTRTRKLYASVSDPDGREIIGYHLLQPKRTTLEEQVPEVCLTHLH